MYKSPRLPGLCAGAGATGGSAVEPSRADYACDVDAAPRGPTRSPPMPSTRRYTGFASTNCSTVGVGATVEKPVKWM